MSSENESILVIRCQLGDSEAWQELVECWHPSLCNFVLRMINDPSTSEDVVQNVWLKIIRSLGRLKEPTRSRAWMYQIARNTVADRLRYQYRQPQLNPLEDVLHQIGEPDQLEITDQLEFGLANLHVSDREVVVLYYLEERPIEEISNICGIPQGTVKSRLYRARTQLREAIDDGQ